MRVPRNRLQLVVLTSAVHLVACGHAETPKLAWSFAAPTAWPDASPQLPAEPLVQSIAPPPTAPARLTFGWPLPAAPVNSLYGERQDPLRHGRGQYHFGIDLEASYGAIVRAAAPGRVSAAGRHGGHGRLVRIEHVGGYTTCYAHLSQVLVSPGTWVRAGAPVGLAGNSGRSTGPHLHFEILKDNVYMDPLPLLGTAVSLASESTF
jgi:murein DD-endopeptidase MepM/ murein hydrolase activator NlpD